MRCLSLVFLSGTLLASCTFPVRPPAGGQSASSESSSASSAEAAVAREEGEELGERAPTTEEITGTGAVAERFLPSGLLELGNESAPLTLLLFTEHHCSYCRQFLTELSPRLRTEYIEKGIVKLQIAMLVLKKYPASGDAALGFFCAAEQGKGLAMHTALFANMNKSAEAILSYAKDLALDTKAFTACIASDGSVALLNHQQVWAQSLSVSVVPTFFLNGEKFIGLPYYPDLRGRIEEALKKAKEE